MKNIKEYLVPTVTLFLICLISSLLLGLTNNLTKDKIAEQEAATKKAAMNSVMPAAEGNFSDEKTITVDGTEYTYAEALDKDGNVIGYAITTIGKGGYSGDIQMMVGINADGTVAEIEDENKNATAAVYVLDQDETKTVGVKKVIDDTAGFLAQFIGISDSASLGSARADGGKVDAVSGATKTSTGVSDAINNALLCYAAITGGEN